MRGHLNLLLVGSILLLEWHYFVDLLGGVAVAALAVLIMDSPSPSSGRRRGQLSFHETAQH